MAKPGKYAAVVAGLPKFQGEAPERQAILDAVKADILSNDEPITYDTTLHLMKTMQIVDGHVDNAVVILKGACAASKHAAAFAGAYADVRMALDHADRWRGSLQLLCDAYEQLMIQQMEAEDVLSLHLESGASVSRRQEPYGKVVDKEAFRLWCINVCQVCGRKKDDHPHVPAWDADESPIKNHVPSTLENALQLWPATMNAIAKERTLLGEDPPDGVEVTAKTLVRLNNA